MISEGFTLPESPFSKEKTLLGDGFLARVPFRSRARRIGYIPQRRHSEARWPKLTDEQRDYIGSTGREVPRSALAIRFGISVDHVARIRAEYKRRELALAASGVRVKVREVA